MTDQINDMQDDDLFEGAQDTFPNKFHLRDRLVVIYPTGEHGTDKGENGSYEWYQSTTVVLDDGPEGWQDQVRDDDGDMVDNLVASVDEGGPVVLNNLRWSAGGLTARMKNKLPKSDGTPQGILGRINSRKGQRGRNASWSIAAPTEEELDYARRFNAQLREARNELAAKIRQGQDEAAF